MARERGYQIIILSKSNKINHRLFSSTRYKIPCSFISGFTDAEGSFMIKFTKPSLNRGWKIGLEFSIRLHVKDISVLSKIKNCFSVGTLTSNDKMAVYSVRSLKDIMNVILPHFDQFPLITQKRADYLLFKDAALFMNDKKHLSLEGLQHIVNIRASMNKGLTTNLILFFHKSVGLTRPNVSLQNIDNDWVAGFTSGDGSFGILINSRNNVSLRLTLSQDARERNLMDSFKTFFGCGNVYKNKTTLDYRVIQFNPIHDIIIPFFKSHKIIGVKNLDFMDWILAASIIKQGRHTTVEGLNEIKLIKERMNKNRVV